MYRVRTKLQLLILKIQFLFEVVPFPSTVTYDRNFQQKLLIGWRNLALDMILQITIKNPTKPPHGSCNLANQLPGERSFLSIKSDVHCRDKHINYSIQ